MGEQGANLITPASPFCVNVSMLYPELTVEAALVRVKSAGFRAVEMWWPLTESDPLSVDLDGLAAVISRSGLRVLMLNAYAGDIRAGDRGIAAYPEEQARFQRSIETAISLCRAITCPLLHVLIGNVRPGDVGFPSQHLVEQLGAAARIGAEAGVRLSVEPQNSIDAPRYPLHTIADALSLASAVRDRTRSEIGVVLDLYHLWRETGKFDFAVDDHLVRQIDHVQIADLPGRGAPGTGSAPVYQTLHQLRRSGYSGAFGLEYVPAGEEDYAWLPPVLRRDGLATQPRTHRRAC